MEEKPANSPHASWIQQLAIDDTGVNTGDRDTVSEGPSHGVGWDGDSDPKNPQNWPTWKINTNAALLTFLTFLTPLASSICAPGVPQIMLEFNNDSPELSAIVVSIYVLGFAFGPLLLAPLSEIYGRLPIYHVCNFGFVCFIVCCALAPSLNSLIAFRFLSGIFGSCPITNGGASIADMVRQDKRGAYMGLVSVGPLLGPIVGPVAGGFLSAAKGWRWVFWLVAILGGFWAIMMFIFASETYVPVILEPKSGFLRGSGGEALPPQDQGRTPCRSSHLKHGIIRPMRLLVFSPISIVCAVYMAVVYGYLYLMFSSITQVFQEYYHFDSDIVGLVFIGLGVGSVIGISIISTTSDRYIRKHHKLGEELSQPEHRLRLVPIGGVLIPVGLFIYGWTCEYRIHWFVPILGMVIVGAGNMMVFMALILYLVDAFDCYAASALAANTFIRSIGGALLPLAGLRMFEALGIGWGNSLLGFVAIAFVPVPFLILRYGKRLREGYPLRNL
ncbi:Fc.00g011080.m01.CDS01 [Cosmosporella sp. VM-42]